MPDLTHAIKKILISNAVALNGGDAAILLSTMAILRRRFGEDVRFTIYDMASAGSSRRYRDLSIRPDLYGLIADWAGARVRPALAASLVLAAAYAHRLPLAGAAMRRLLPPDLQQALADYADADLVVSSGGTYLVPHYALSAKLFDFLFTRALGKPLVLFTQSLGPFPARKYRFLLRRALRGAAIILVRDERSRLHLEELGIPGDHVRVCADAAFALAPADLAGRAFPPSRTPWRIAISVRDWPHFRSGTNAAGMERYLDAMAVLAGHLVKECGATVTFISTCQGAPEYWTDDSRTATKVWDRLPEELRARVTVDRAFRRPGELIAELSRYDLTIATRLHAAILSLCAGTPVLPISYEFKTTELFRRLGLGGAVIDIEAISPKAILAAFAKTSSFWSECADERWRAVRAESASAFGAGNHIANALAHEPGAWPSNER